MHREYSRAKEGLVSVIIDSYDKAKLSLPRFPFGRVPKKSIYEETRRAWTSSSFLLNFKLRQKFCLCCVVCFTTWCISVVLRVCFEKKKTRYLPDVNGSYLPWLGLLHVSFFRSTERRIKLELGVCSSPLFECFGMSMRWIRFFLECFCFVTAFQERKVLRSLDLVYARAMELNLTFPCEQPGGNLKLVNLNCLFLFGKGSMCQPGFSSKAIIPLRIPVCKSIFLGGRVV